MTKLSLTLPPDLLDRLNAIADQKELSRQQCALEAIVDYVDSWEDFHRTVERLEIGEEERTVLSAASE
jgi:predicted transcriptional regulator